MTGAACVAIALLALAAAPVKKPLPADPAARMPPLPPALIDGTLEVGGDDIDAKKVETRMTVAVRVNGRGPYRFVVDSGADSSVVGNRVAKALALPAGTPVTLNGMTASARVPRVLVDTLDVGPTTIDALELPVLAERDLGGDGMLGIDALVRQRLLMDFEKKAIKVEDATVRAPRLDGEIVVTARLRRGQLILTQARASGKAVAAVVDTGSEITIGNVALRDALLRRSTRFETIEVIGVTGVAATLQMARVRELRLGPVILQDVPIAFAEVPPFAVFGLSNEPAMLLGTDLLATFRKVQLDFRARKVRFQLRRCAATGIAVNTAPTGAFMRVSVAADRAGACAG